MISKSSIPATFILVSFMLLGACSSDDDAAPLVNNDGGVTTDPVAGGADDDPATGGTDDNPATGGTDDDPLTGGTDDDPITEVPPVPPTTGTDDPDTGVDPGGEQGSKDTSAIAGLWDVSEEQFFIGESLGLDVYYLEISSDGTQTGYDYQQDEFDMGENCYEIYPAELVALGNGEYLLDPDTAFELKFSAAITDDTLAVSYVDIFDDNENEDVTEVLSFNYPRLTGVDPVFNECTE